MACVLLLGIANIAKICIWIMSKVIPDGMCYVEEGRVWPRKCWITINNAVLGSLKINARIPGLIWLWWIEFPSEFYVIYTLTSQPTVDFLDKRDSFIIERTTNINDRCGAFKSTIPNS